MGQEAGCNKGCRWGGKMKEGEEEKKGRGDFEAEEARKVVKRQSIFPAKTDVEPGGRPRRMLIGPVLHRGLFLPRLPIRWPQFTASFTPINSRQSANSQSLPSSS
jgi:hypothetical protein